MRQLRCLATLALALPTTLVAQSAGDTNPGAAAILSRAVYELPTFDHLTPDQRRDLDRYADSSEYRRTRLDRRFVLSRVQYRSDTLSVVAYLYAPRAAAGGRLPAIVYNRGSYIAGDLAPSLAPLFHRLGEAGFVVVAPQYRGSDGGEGRDEMGGADVDDVLNAVTLARGLPRVDSSRVFMYGESRGGMMTFQAIRRGAPVRAAATVGAFADLDDMLAADPRAAGAATQIWPDYASRRADLQASRSAIRWVDELQTPLLLLHGGADRSVPPRQTLALASRLEALGREYEVHVFAGEGHVLGDRSRERDRLVVDWFRRHIPE